MLCVSVYIYVCVRECVVVRVWSYGDMFAAYIQESDDACFSSYVYIILPSLCRIFLLLGISVVQVP